MKKMKKHKETQINIEDLYPAFPLLAHVDKRKCLTLINQLDAYQQRRHGESLEVSGVIQLLKDGRYKPPVEPRPEAPVHTDMDESELGRFMKEKPQHQARVK